METTGSPPRPQPSGSVEFARRIRRPTRENGAFSCRRTGQSLRRRCASVAGLNEPVIRTPTAERGSQREKQPKKK